MAINLKTFHFIEKKKQLSMGGQDDFIKIGGIVGVANNNQRRALSKNDPQPSY